MTAALVAAPPTGGEAPAASAGAGTATAVLDAAPGLRLEPTPVAGVPPAAVAETTLEVQARLAEELRDAMETLRSVSDTLARLNASLAQAK